MMMPIEPSKTPKQTLVEEGTEFKGTLKSSCPVVVNGTIDGEVDAPEITITRSGAVLGAIKAKKVRSQGTLSGNVDAGDVFLSGSVRSNTVIKAKSLEVKLGSEKGQLEVTFGDCNLEVGDAASASDGASASTTTTEESSSEASKDVRSGDGWTSLETTDSTPAASSTNASSTPSSSGRSSWKSSRVIEASASASDESKTTLR
jgi:cytoskeletal protein CcmA (bactofilin family)